MNPLIESTNLDVQWDGEAQRVSSNFYKQMVTPFTVRDKNGNDTHFVAGDYVMGNGLFVWGVEKAYFDENYKVLSKTVRDEVDCDCVCCDEVRKGDK